MSGIKGGKCGQKIQCQDPCKDPCQRPPVCVDPCQDPCKPRPQHHHHYGLRQQDPCNPCCPDPCQGQGNFCCDK